MKIRANGIEIACEVAGQGPWLVLCHSLGMNRSSWFRQLSDFAKDHRVLTWDARGHGESTKAAGPYDFHIMASDLTCLLDALEVQRAAVIGLSMGGCIAQAFAAANPGRVSAVVLSDTTAWYGAEALRNWGQRIRNVREGGLGSIVDFQVTRWFTDSFRAAHPDLVEKVVAILLANEPECYIATQEALGSMDLRRDAANIRCPALVVVGREDGATPPNMAEELHRLILGSELVILEEAKHLTPIELPDSFNPIVLEFLARVHARRV